jgi:6-pyruvoyltetrahydropterin/6-carboxytetrahydropterin synthase
MPEVTITKRIRISAAHHIPNHPGKCARPHGHNYTIEVSMTGQVSFRTGFVRDFYLIKQDLHDVIEDVCDHQDLNAIYPYLLTTAENLAIVWLTALVRRDPRYSSIRVYETDDCWAEVHTHDLNLLLPITSNHIEALVVQLPLEAPNDDTTTMAPVRTNPTTE